MFVNLRRLSIQFLGEQFCGAPYPLGVLDPVVRVVLGIMVSGGISHFNRDGDWVWVGCVLSVRVVSLLGIELAEAVFEGAS